MTNVTTTIAGVQPIWYTEPAFIIGAVGIIFFLALVAFMLKMLLN